MRSNAGAPSNYYTWFAVWLECNRLSSEEFARIVMVSVDTVDKWRAGCSTNAHFAKLVRAFFPDAPFNNRGGPIVKINQPLPVQSRSKAMYKHIFKISGMIQDRVHPDALAKARGIVDLGL